MKRGTGEGNLGISRERERRRGKETDLQGERW